MVPHTAKRIAFLHTADDVIAHLGGIEEVAKLTRRQTTAVYNWRALGRFSARTFAVMTDALARRGAVAPRELWSQEGSADNAAA